MSEITPEQREAAKQALLQALRVRHPGRPITVEWHEPDALTDAQPAARPDLEGGEHAA